MKQTVTFIFFLSTLFLSAQTIADFENFELIPDAFLNGSDGSGGFQSGNIILPNSYNPDWDSWSGWAISSTTDTLTPGFTNQYSSITGGGVDNSNSYAVSFISGESILQLAEPQTVNGFHITLNTYAYWSMLEGDDFAKKFGGATGDDPDFYLLTIKKYQGGQLSTDSIDFYLADYRFEDNTQDYIIKDWTYLDLSSLGTADSLSFTVASSDVGQFGINTPTYICIDNVQTSIGVTTDLEVVDIAEWVQVFPNPSTDFIQLKKQTLDPIQLSIFAIDGREMVSTILESDQALDVRAFNKGTYIIRLIQGNKQASQLLIKQ